MATYRVKFMISSIFSLRSTFTLKGYSSAHWLESKGSWREGAARESTRQTRLLE